MMTMSRTSLFLIFALSWSSTFAEQTLSNIAVYNRCYGKLTNSKPLPTATQTLQVANGSLDPITACMNVLNKALLTTSGGPLANQADVEAKAVIKTMHNLHASWMQVQDFKFIEILSTNQDLYDTTAPAAYLTNALLSPTPSYRSIVAGSTMYGILRTNMAPAAGPMSGKDKTNLANVFTEPFNYAGIGEILGLRVTPPTTIAGNVPYRTPATANLYISTGGGILGDNTYVSLNASVDESFVADGAARMPRRWSRAVFHDLLCRNLPALRNTDASNYVIPTAQAPFRQSQSCIHCHASMDQMAGTIRGIRTISLGDGGAAPKVDTLAYRPVTQAAEGAWPSSADANFAARPTNGLLYYRNYLGNLVNTPASNVETLGAAIAQQDDYYICAAKRYYEYFTGVTVTIGDIGDPAAPALSAGELNRRNILIDLGLKLKTHDNPRQLIKDIMSLPHYRDSSFGQN